MKNRFSKIIAMLLAVAMIAGSNGSVVLAMEEDAVIVEETVEVLGDNNVEETVENVTEDQEVNPKQDSFMSAPIAELTAAQTDNAALLEEEIKKLQKLSPDKDYVPNEAVFLADTMEEAERVAKSYGAKLEHYDVGVATITWTDENVGDAFQEIVDDVDTILEAKDEVESAGFDTFCLETVKETDSLLFEKLKDIDVENIPDVLVEPNHISYICSVNPSNDPLYTGSNPGDESKQWFQAAVNSASAWNRVDGSGVVVAVIDTGIDTSNNDLVDSMHPDHVEALYSSKSFTNGDDDNGHGTHCAGIVAALDNSVGGLGIAPNAKIISIKAGDYYGRLRDADINQAISMAIDRKVDIISMSFGSSVASKSTEKLLKKAVDSGITCVAAAGNESSKAYKYPGAYDCTICVGATDPYADGGYALAEYSNYGSWVDVCAPGTAIYSTMPNNAYCYLRREGRFIDAITSGYTYGKLNGTSMATPVVAGVAALVKCAHPDYSPEQIRNAILNSSPDKEYHRNYRIAYRGVDASTVIDASTADPEFIDGPYEIDDSEFTKPSIDIPTTHTLELGVGEKVDVAQGKSVAMNAVLLPADKNKIQYSCLGSDGISVSSTGVIKVTRTAAVGSSAVVTAKWKNLSASTTVNVTASSSGGTAQRFTVKKSHENDISSASGVGDNYVELYVDPAEPEKYYRYTVSGKNTALFDNHSTTIVAKGNTRVRLYAAGNGKVTVTAYATDGSGLKSTAKVTCYTPLTGVDITYAGVPIRNDIHVAPGGKLKLGTKAYGTSISATNGKVTYTWETEGSSVNIVNNGTVSIPTGSYGNSYTIKLTAESGGSSKSATLTIKVDKKEKIKKFGIYWTNWRGKNKYYTTLPGYITGVAEGELDVEAALKEVFKETTYVRGFYTTPSKGTPDYEEYVANEGNYAISVSNEKNLTHVKYGDYGISKFTPAKKGTYKITLTALDGSGKTFVMNVKVNP